ncbi:ABC transporter permease [Paenibacillus medicaginis]|uniref:ABC transporter permease n=1 Tax=Paenibacillus medicaginis TaxID=1470560 RepID=A0ABV5C836_9BACL
MNIVNTLTLRHLKQNKRRTLVTIIGVIISVAMVTAVSTLVFSFADLMIRQTIADTGEWHVQYQDVTKEQLAAIQGDDATKTVAITRDLGYASLEGGQNPNKPYLFIKEYDALGFAQFQVELSKGRLPHTDKEVVISESVATNAKVKYDIGDRLTLRIGERFEQGSDHPLDQSEPLRRGEDTLNETLQHIKIKDFTVVGFIKRPAWETAVTPSYTVISYVDDHIIGGNDRVDASVVLQRVHLFLFAHAEELAEKNQIETVQYNNDLLHYYGLSSSGASSSMMFSLSAILMAVIMIGSVALIYNAFAISVAERSRHLGMLASVGATKRQKRNSVLFEGFVIGLICIPIGILCGLAGIGITFGFMNGMIEEALWTDEKLRLIVTPLSLLSACLVSMLTIFVSAYLPAIQASKVSAMDAIRQTTDIKLTAKAVKTSKFIRRFFGIEAEIGLKNLKRNRRRYHAIVFSLVISIVLFLTVSFFTEGMTQSLELSQEGVDYDIEVSYSNGQRIDDRLMQSIVSLDSVTEYNVIHEDDEDRANASTYLHLKSTEPMKTQQEIEEMHETNLNVYNVYQSRKNEEQQILLMSVFSYGFIVLISAISIANIFNTISTGAALRKREFAMLKSVGMTPKGFAKMMNYESVFYGVKSLLFGLPVSFIVMVLIYRAFANKFSYGFTLPWMSILSVIVAVFVIVGSAMVYSGAKVKKENIIDALKQENI